MTQSSYQAGERIHFTLPYIADSVLTFSGIILQVEKNSLVVKYETRIGDSNHEHLSKFTTHIPMSFVVHAS
ncbi:MAG: hypothetical protein K9I70_09245 [Chitinophagaceae bacterium]|jgi:hypothetical protein|nr:hypothetical protein [Chitinophagaceae bacterium]